jgi:glucokinase-like ROK family protein
MGELNGDGVSSLALVIQAVRRTGVTTRPDVVRATGLSRTLVTKYIDIALSLGLLEEGELGASTGGRAPRILQFNAHVGVILVAELGASGMSIAMSDLRGNISECVELDIEIAEGPEKVLNVVEKVFDQLIDKRRIHNIWGIGIGLPGPVEFATGIPMSPPIMPGWDGYLVRQRFAEKYNVPVWVDNDVNLMALGEASKNHDKRNNELIYIKMGSGIGAGILTHGQLHRGAQGCAGDIGHIAIAEPTDVVCRCGNVGCLEAIAGGVALARDAMEVARSGNSRFLALRLKSNKKITPRDVIEGAKNGDKWCIDAVTGAGRQVGQILATLVNFHNPSSVVIGGGISAAGNPLLAAIRETVFRRSLPLATRDLEIRLGDTDDQTGLIGAAEMVISELFEPEFFRQWVNAGFPDATLIH